MDYFCPSSIEIEKVRTELGLDPMQAINFIRQRTAMNGSRLPRRPGAYR